MLLCDICSQLDSRLPTASTRACGWFNWQVKQFLCVLADAIMEKTRPCITYYLGLVNAGYRIICPWISFYYILLLAGKIKGK